MISGTALVCYECHELDEHECGEHEWGKGVTCQMENPQEENYGNSCYVAHTGQSIILVIFVTKKYKTCSDKTLEVYFEIVIFSWRRRKMATGLQDAY